MNEIIEKYEAKLDYLSKGVEQTKHLMDEDTLDMMNDMKILLTEVVTDFKIIRELNGGDK
jgi:DNA-binding ferritin-like protein